MSVAPHSNPHRAGASDSNRCPPPGYGDGSARAAWLIVLFGAALWWASSAWAKPITTKALDAELGNGVNVTALFRNQHDPDLGQLQNAFARIHELGFQHVRIDFDDEMESDAGRRELRSVTQSAIDHGLVAILSYCPMDEVKRSLLADANSLATAADRWRELTRTMKDFDRQRLLFELLNEPATDDSDELDRVHRALLSAVRTQDAARVIAVMPPRYNSARQLTQEKPIADDAVIYSFHFYDPFEFTHQGATWVQPAWRSLHDLPYPPSAGAIDRLLATMPQDAQAVARGYGHSKWSSSAIAAIMRAAAAWADRNGVGIWCSEFGVFRKHAPNDSRLRWLRDVRIALNASAIPWTIWDYDSEGFGIARVEGVDRPMADSLGMGPGRSRTR